MENNTRGKVVVVVGGQYGSEAKGLACQHLLNLMKFHYAVRTGAINAGHTVYHEGKAHAMCQIPVAWVNPDVQLVLGAGTYVEPEVLDQEIRDIQHAGAEVRHRLLIDRRAYTHFRKFYADEVGMHQRMGSTGHGCGAAIIDKIQRKSSDNLFKNVGNKNEFVFADTAEVLNDALEAGENVLLEGTQGTLLDLHLGEHPHTTSRQTTASAWLTEAGLPPVNVEVIMVLRTCPIRVAGSSGTLANETSWYELVKAMNLRRQARELPPLVDPTVLEKWGDAEKEVAISLGLPALPHELFGSEREKYGEVLSIFHSRVLDKMSAEEQRELKKVIEMTTVTKKVRRIARLDLGDVRQAAVLNHPSAIFLNFLNYRFPELWGATTLEGVAEGTLKEVKKYIADVEEAAKAPVKWVSTSATTVIDL